MATERTVTVVGHGSARVVPDAAVLRVAAATRAASVQEAFRGTASAVQQLLDLAREAVGEAAVASQGIDVWTAEERGRPAGFECRHTLAVRCPSLEVAGALLGDLVAAVGDRLQVHGVSLEVTDPSAADRAARAAAYADAEAKAAELAALAGAVVGQPVTIVEGGTGGGWMPQSGARAAAVSEAMPIAAGEQSVTALLTVTFALG